MTNNTLYLVQSSFNASPTIFKKLENLHSENDAVVLMGEAVLHANNTFIQNLNHIYVLENEVENLTQSISEKIQVISYAQFADLALNFKRSISLK